MSSSVKSLEKMISLKELIDEAVKIASFRGKTKSTAINNILEVLESESEGEGALILTAAYVLRQASRDVIDTRMARSLALKLVEIARNKDLSGPEKKENARKLLGLIKWIAETSEGLKVDLSKAQTFEEFVNLLAKR